VTKSLPEEWVKFDLAILGKPRLLVWPWREHCCLWTDPGFQEGYMAHCFGAAVISFVSTHAAAKSPAQAEWPR